VRLRIMLQAAVVTLWLAAVPAAQARTGCSFVLGFRALHDRIPDVVGDCVENEAYSRQSGAASQQTTRGRLIWRQADNWTAFTDRSTTWVSGPGGVVPRPNETLLPGESPPSGTLVFEETWLLGRGLWIGSEDWRATDGTLTTDGSNGWSRALAPYGALTADYAVDAQVQWVRGDGGFGIVVQGQPGDDAHFYRAGYEGGTWIVAPGQAEPSLASRPSRRDTDVHVYRVEVRGASVRLLVDGALQVEASGGAPAPGRSAGLWAANAMVKVRRFAITTL